MDFSRSSGILMHISSLPGKYGIGDVGTNAYQWIDMLEETGTRYWQMLPLNPTGYGNSPYQGISAFAGNPLFIDLAELQKLSLLSKDDITNFPEFPLNHVDFSRVINWKRKKLETAYCSFNKMQSNELEENFEKFYDDNKSWLFEFSTFMSIREKYALVSWSQWPEPLKMRDPAALNQFRVENQQSLQMHSFFQFIFQQQWNNLKKYANGKGIRIIGDIPIFMGFDCSDVWAYPELFLLDEKRKPTFVAGVPPDFFSETGQLWGNPLYDWAEHKEQKYQWWIKRVRETLKTVDLIRLDHFRGFAGFYKIPADEKTAEKGKWVPGPGKDLFDVMEKEIGDLPFIAEDLGVITPDVISLRERYNFPGMKIFQFAFWEDAEFLPYNYPKNCVAYTGTHDNDTTKSWFEKAPKHEQLFCANYLGQHTENIAHEMIRIVWSSVANLAVAPMQDFLRLGNEARMNLPASIEGNWEWRMKPDAIKDSLKSWIKEINITFNRDLNKDDLGAKAFFQKSVMN